MILTKLYRWWQSLRYYVIADPADNSITLSRALFSHIRGNAKEGDAPRVFVFWVPSHRTFGFMPSPDIEQPTQMCDIQYNDKYRCIGFETLCPSVGKILWNYSLPATRRVKLSISVHKDASGKTFYQIERPCKQQPRTSNPLSAIWKAY